MNLYIRIVYFLFLIPVALGAQVVKEFSDSLVVSGGEAVVVVNRLSGKVDYHFSNGSRLINTIAYIDDIHLGRICTSAMGRHLYSTEAVNDSIGKGIQINIRHADDQLPLVLTQTITLYEHNSYILTGLVASATARSLLLETRNISPLAILSSQQGSLFVAGDAPRILDMPFDNDNWVPILERKWKEDNRKNVSGIGYELCAVYDNNSMSGLVMGSVAHDFWKTGFSYKTGTGTGVVDSLNIFGGAATADDPSLPAAYGGRDGTHDHMPHGTMVGVSVHSPVIFICGADIRKAFTGFGETYARLNGRLSWTGNAPVYWNSFGVEDVLGYRGVMMPAGVSKISDFIHTLKNFNAYSKPVLSVDSYDQSIYTTELLASLGRYAQKQQQQIGFYFIPFSIWTWKNSIEQTQLQGTAFALRDAVLRDGNNVPVQYKEGDWAAYALDPTHPGTRQFIIGQLQKAKTIHASFLKIDFLTGGALESSTRYDPAVRSGMQAYSYGMKMLKHLIDSILGPDIFITEAISPMFPSQYAHTRFLSTDVYSHFRDDQPGFPNWGSTEASLATGSHTGWVQGTLWPFTNLDVSVMKRFQKNPDLDEVEVKVRLYAMMAMGSILGDGSDFREKLAAERAKKFLDNKAVCKFFSQPKAFTPLKFADGESLDQQLSFYLPGDTVLLAMFNFSTRDEFRASYEPALLGLAKGKYIISDFMTDEVLGHIDAAAQPFTLAVPKRDAWLVKIIHVKE